MPDYLNSAEFHYPAHDPMQRPRQGRDCHPYDTDAAAHAASWLAHVEAGRIGNIPPADPKIAAKRARNEEILRRHF